MLQTILKQRNAYYLGLSDSGQKKFESRLLEFASSKKFVGYENLVITDEMKILISAAAVQLSFGLEDYKFSNFHTINVFPSSFRSTKYKVSFKSLTTRDGVISLSWKDFVNTQITAADKLNLGLYEMAHALYLDLNDKKKYKNHFSNYLGIWKKAVLPDFFKLKTGQLPFFKGYGGANLYDFFAMCTEYFFEVPQEFQKRLPNVYGHIAMLLNQDAVNKGEDYALKKEHDYFPESKAGMRLLGTGNNRVVDETKLVNETKFQRFVRRKGLYTAMIATVLGFICIPVLFWFLSVTVIGVGIVLTLLFVLGVLGLLQWRYVKDQLELAYHQFAMYAFVGFGMCSLNFLFLINYLFSIGSYTETYPVTRASSYYQVATMGDKASDELDRCLSLYVIDNELSVYSVR